MNVENVDSTMKEEIGKKFGGDKKQRVLDHGMS